MLPEITQNPPIIEAAVDDGVVHGGAHGQPHNSQVDLLDELLQVPLRVEILQGEVDVVRQPAQRECAYHNDHHLHYLCGEESTGEQSHLLENP